LKIASRTAWLSQSDDDLIASCHVDTYRASGPGGQKRNKTSSAVRLRHMPSGISVIAEESRSQHENKARAVRRLRLAIALQVREPPQDTKELIENKAKNSFSAEMLRISHRNRDYPLAVGAVLDAIHLCEGRLKESGSLLGVSTAQLSKFLVADPKLQAAVNDLRRKSGLNPLHD
jgi:hypothetical protein